MNFKVWCRKERRYIASYHTIERAKNYVNTLEVAKHFGLLNIECWNEENKYIKQAGNNSIMIELLKATGN